MRKFLPVIIIIFAAVYAWQQFERAGRDQGAGYDAPAAQADANWYAGQQVSGSGRVVRILSDDNDGSRHQRFILELASGRTVLVAHNIDLAPRIASLQTGDTVGFFGEFETNDRGGVIHWTHHDPQGRHPDGWLEHEGRRYR